MWYVHIFSLLDDCVKMLICSLREVHGKLLSRPIVPRVWPHALLSWTKNF
jgi:hypothetical protein